MDSLFIFCIFGLNKNMPNYNCFHVNCYLKATCNILFLYSYSISLQNCTVIFSFFDIFYIRRYVNYINLVRTRLILNFQSFYSFLARSCVCEICHKMSSHLLYVHCTVNLIDLGLFVRKIVIPCFWSHKIA